MGGRRPRTLAEVKRGVTPREQYEAESRAIRYNLYKECAATHGFPAVFVGHHEVGRCRLRLGLDPRSYLKGFARVSNDGLIGVN